MPELWSVLRPLREVMAKSVDKQSMGAQKFSAFARADAFRRQAIASA
jgi:hypothetical protein